MILEVKNVSKSYHGIKALDNITLSIDKHGCYGVLGRNGAGKSTLLNIIAGYIPPSSNSATKKCVPNGAV